jgi:hypothetical protein
MAGKAKRMAAHVQKMKDKRSKKQANAAKYSSRVGTDANKKKKGIGGRLSTRMLARCSGGCGNIGCTKCSQIARMGEHNRLVRSVGPAKADQMCEARGWM